VKRDDSPTILPRLALVGLLASASVLVGCAGGQRTRAVPGAYRTVVTEPWRDTEAAKRAYAQGLEHLEADRLDEAQQAFERSLTADVEFGPAHNNLGVVFYRQQQWYQAAWEFENAARLMPNRAAPRNNLGLVLERAGELTQAIEHFREAVRLEPGSIVYRANLVRALVGRGDRTDEVRELLEAVLAEDDRPQWLIWAQQQLTRLRR